MDYTGLIYTIHDRVCTIVMNRLWKRNALDETMVRELTNAFVCASKDGAVKVIVLTGIGDVFSAGRDIPYREKGNAADFGSCVEDAKLVKRLAQIIYSIRKPVIAKVNGHAHGSGCLLTAICDYVVASPQATFGFTEVRNGMLPAIAVPFLVKKIGEGKAREFMLRGAIVSASQAMLTGLVTMVSQPETLDVDTAVLADELCACVSGSSMGLLKEMFVTMEGMKFNEAIDYAANMQAAVRMTEECRKGIEGLLKNEIIMW